MADGIYVQDGDSFQLKKNTTKIIRFPAFSYSIHTNEFGFRDKSTGPKELEGKSFYAFLGASDVFGNGVEYKDSFVGIFDGEAQKQGREVVNLATGGHYFLDQEHLLKRLIENTNYQPEAVLLCVNALHIPKFDQRNKHIIVKSGYPIDRDGWRITYLRLLAGNISSAFCFFRDGSRKIQEKWFNHRLSIKSPEFLEIYSRANSMHKPERIKAFEEYLASFEAFCQNNGIDLTYVYLPISDSFRLNDMLNQIGLNSNDYDAFFYENLIRSHCEKSKLKLINLRPILQQQYDEGRELRFKLDPHFNVFANRIIGEYLVREIL